MQGSSFQDPSETVCSLIRLKYVLEKITVKNASQEAFAVEGSASHLIAKEDDNWGKEIG